ncbi:MAG: LamG domain-containing protein, partial [Bacteroidota bacterium]
VKKLDTTGDDRVVAKSNSIYPSDPGYIFSLGVYGATVRVRLAGTSHDAGTISANTWYHLAFTYDGATLNIYIDGALSASYSKSGAIPASAVTGCIGNNDPGLNNRYWNGLIEEVRIWTANRTQQQIRENMHRRLAGTETGLAAYWRFDEGSTTTTSDATGNGNTGTLTNGPAWTVSTAPLGSGISNTQTVSSTASVAFTGADLEMNFTAKSGTDDFVVTAITSSPGGTQPVGAAPVAPRYWVARKYGSGTFTADLTFTIGPGTISAGDQATPGNLKLFSRGSNDDGSWTLLASGSSATSSAATFSGISTFSQFAIGTTGDSPLPIQLASAAASVIRDNDVEVTWRT